jgi:DNA repair exonuclease SbcCD ATPase subunit
MNATIQRRMTGRQLGSLSLLMAAVLMLCSTGSAATAQDTQAIQELPAPQEQQTPSSTDQDPLWAAAQKKILTLMLDQLQQQTREAEASLQQHNAAADDQAPILLADVQALHERIRNVQQEMDNLTRVGPGPGGVAQTPAPVQELRQIDAQMQQLTRQREDLARVVRQLETQLRQLPPGQEQGRRWLQGELDRIRGLLRGVDEQMTALQRERLHADYAATLQTRPPTRLEPPRANPPANPTPETAKLIAGLSAQLKQLQDLAQQNQRELEQIQDQEGPRARELQGSLADVRRQTQAIQDRLRAMEQERTVDRLEAADRQRQAFESYVQQMGRRLEELRQSVETIRQDLRGVQDQVRQTQQTRTATDESIRRTAQQSIDQLRAESLRQQEELRNQIRSMEERLRVATERAGTGAEAFRKDLDSLRADLQRMGQTVGRIERERLDAQVDLRNQVRQLEGQVSDLRKDVALVQGTLNMMLSQMGRSTVGSAGYPWGW